MKHDLMKPQITMGLTPIIKTKVHHKCYQEKRVSAHLHQRIKEEILYKMPFLKFRRKRKSSPQIKKGKLKTKNNTLKNLLRENYSNKTMTNQWISRRLKKICLKRRPKLVQRLKIRKKKSLEEIFRQ